MTGREPASSARHRSESVEIEAIVGPQLVGKFYGLMRAVRLYDLSNQTIQDQIHEFLALLEQIMDEEVVLVAMGQCFYVNGVRLRAQSSQGASFDALTAEFETRNLGGARFLHGLRPDELGEFLRLLARHADAARAAHFSEAAAAAGVVHATPITLEELQSLSQELEQETSTSDASVQDERRRARETFARAMTGTKSAILNTAKTGKPAIRKVQRVIQPIVDTIMKDEHSIVGLTAIKVHDEYTYAHCVNVSILSVAMGQILGLSRAALANLGVAALLHDIGKLRIPAEVLQKAGHLDQAEWALMHRHPMEGLIMAIRMPGLSGITLDLVDVCLHHHLATDGSGYPRIAHPRRLSTFTRIVSVADCFDAMTSHRAYRKRPFTGYEALQILLGPERAKFDGAALWALLKSIGLYPAGSLLVTNTGHLVISLGGNTNDIRRPNCRVLGRPDGSMPSDVEPELWDPMPEGIRVERVVPPDEFDVEVDQLLAA
jgi:HD-GYP domain-containing protein (c-di-GMP phosphodiesterase class II)